MRLKNILKFEFDMKNLGNAKKILGMVTNRNKHEDMLTITQESYLHKVITKFGMKEIKSVNVPLATQMNLSSAQCPKTKSEIKDMTNIPYANAIGPVMFIANPGKQDWAKVAIEIYCRNTKGDNCITCKCQLQSIVTLSSAEALYVAITECVKECIWLKGILSELNFMNTPTIILTDG
ncbi:uncharacterized protein LOC111406695 [Olea europaea var. sylvestris]|uniref:uncharacterized protein LOC111406695 n=1 Tax=Olea europaea var. sylvestris TaxID=158386 RepID=UPI000C1D0819|nr:uncharacterized protein LOC111406695 [Olea europaea var. sylvestris]